MPTFLGLPQTSLETVLPGDVVILGACDATPYETARPSHARGGPDAIRSASARYASWHHHHDFDVDGPMLDAAGRQEVMERLEGLRGARTVLHVTHHLDELLDADRILVLNAGRLVADVSPERLFSDADLLRENRLALPPILRLAAGLGLGRAKPRTPEELAAAILREKRPGVEAR